MDECCCGPASYPSEIAETQLCMSRLTEVVIKQLKLSKFLGTSFRVVGSYIMGWFLYPAAALKTDKDGADWIKTVLPASLIGSRLPDIQALYKKPPREFFDDNPIEAAVAWKNLITVLVNKFSLPNSIDKRLLEEQNFQYSQISNLIPKIKMLKLEFDPLDCHPVLNVPAKPHAPPNLAIECNRPEEHPWVIEKMANLFTFCIRPGDELFWMEVVREFNGFVGSGLTDLRMSLFSKEGVKQGWLDPQLIRLVIDEVSV